MYLVYKVHFTHHKQKGVVVSHHNTLSLNAEISVSNGIGCHPLGEVSHEKSDTSSLFCCYDNNKRPIVGGSIKVGEWMFVFLSRFDPVRGEGALEVLFSHLGLGLALLPMQCLKTPMRNSNI